MSSTSGPSLVFMHTSPSHIATFDRLRDQLAPARTIGHVVREDLLCAVRKAGQVTTAVEIKLGEALTKIAEAGAKRIVCTCSTLGGVAERAHIEGAKVLRIDRPMVRQAVAIGGRVAVCAVLAETVGPTLALVDEEVTRIGHAADVQSHIFDGAWEDFRAGRQQDYYEGIAARLRAVARDADVVVLAQASMAPAADLCRDLDVPILSSPETGFVAALT
jgi:Asp/Glu/hydantoin racemase